MLIAQNFAELADIVFYPFSETFIVFATFFRKAFYP